MKETIYTIPVNEAFDAYGDGVAECPFCRLYKKLQENELDGILGAAMMESDIRIKTNALGFCPKHYADMLKKGNRLSMALILESHLDEIYRETTGENILKKPGAAATERIEKLNSSCYICDKIEFNFSKMIDTAVLLWKYEPEFRKKTSAQPFICLPHYERFLRTADKRLDKKGYKAFYDALRSVTMNYFEELRSDVSWFCKKFDYRYGEEPWGNAKDAPERAVKFLGGDSEFNVSKK